MRKIMLALNLVMIAALVFTPAALAQDEDPVEVEFTCIVLEVDLVEGSFTCETEQGEIYSVYPPEDFDWSTLEVGDVYEVEGTLAEDDSVIAEKLDLEEPDEEDEGEEGDDEGEGEVGYFCRAESEDQHPVGAALAETYETEYEQVMLWFCEGKFGFGQIMLALQTGKMEGLEVDAGELLTRRAEGEGWGQIWKDMGLIGKDAQADPPGGPPEWAGPPEDKGKSGDTGRPEWAGPPDDKGKPEGTGRPEWAGPPAGKGKP